MFLKVNFAGIECKKQPKQKKKKKNTSLSHLLIAGCDIGVQISVSSRVRSSIRPSTFTSKFSFLDIRDSCESETLHSNCP